jgi:magnesium chelatase subunit D
MALVVHDDDLRQKEREKRIGTLIVFVVDSSGSMGAGKRMVEVKSAILSLLVDAYQKRDKVALVAFRGNEADVLLPPTTSVEFAYRHLEELPTGGKTPLAHGMALGYQVVDSSLRRDPHTIPVFVLISDGRANVSYAGGKPLAEVMELAEAIGDDGRMKSLVVDVEKGGQVSLGLARRLSDRLGGQYFKIEDLKSESLVQVLKNKVL